MSNSILKLVKHELMDNLVVESLSSLNINLKHTRKLELSARLQGYPSLNHRKADEKSIKDSKYKLLISGIDTVEDSDVEYTEINYFITTISHADLDKIIKIANAIDDLGLSSAFIDSCHVAYAKLESIEDMIELCNGKGLSLRKSFIDSIIESEDSIGVGVDKIEIYKSLSSELTYEPVIRFRAKEKYGLYVQSDYVKISDLVSLILSNGNNKDSFKKCVESGVYLIKD